MEQKLRIQTSLQLVLRICDDELEVLSNRILIVFPSPYRNVGRSYTFATRHDAGPLHSPANKIIHLPFIRIRILWKMYATFVMTEYKCFSGGYFKELSFLWWI